jgi:MinD-like ATPase involved in chromosome partitioning or flagellar assembly
MAVVDGGDQGQPVVIARPESATARAFQSLAQRISSLSLAAA